MYAYWGVGHEGLPSIQSQTWAALLQHPIERFISVETYPPILRDCGHVSTSYKTWNAVTYQMPASSIN